MGMEIVLFLAVGMAVGCVGAMLGIGGGIIIVPLMSFVFGATPQEAAGTSMFVVLFNSLSGAWGYYKQKRICWDAAWKFALATIPGGFLGSYVAHYLESKTLFIIFGVFFAVMAMMMFLKTDAKSKGETAAMVPDDYDWKLGTVCSVVVGFIASILGIGGGIIHVPMMTYLLKFPVKTAIATSTAILTVSALSGAVSHAFLGHVLWTPALGLAVGAVVGAQIGVRLASKTKSSLLMKLTALLVLAVGVKFILDVI